LDWLSKSILVYSIDKWKLLISITSNSKSVAAVTSPSGGTEKDSKKCIWKISKEERQRRIKENLCLYCGQPGHTNQDCPAKKTKGSHGPKSVAAAIAGDSSGSQQ
jgi:hypothetical protein